MKYFCRVKKISYGAIEVEADSRQEAQDKAETQYLLGNTFWTDGEYEISAEDPRKTKRQRNGRNIK